MKTISQVCSLWLALLLISPILAEDNVNAGQQAVDNGARFEATANRLDLTDEQREKIRALRRSQIEQMKALLQELQTKREQIKNELNNSNATRESIAPLATEIKNIQAKMVDLRIDNIFAIKEMLTSEQFNQLKEMRQKNRRSTQGYRPFWHEKQRMNKEEKNLE